VVIDSFFACLLFFLSGTLGGNIVWVGLMPISTAALYFQLSGGLLTAITMLVLQGFLSLGGYEPDEMLVQLGYLTLFYLVYALLVGYISKLILIRMRNTEQSQKESEQAARREEQKRIRTIYNIISAMNASLNYQHVLDDALDLAYSTFATLESSGDRLVSAVLLFTENENQTPQLKVGSARRFTPADMRVTLPGAEGLIGRTIYEGEARFTHYVTSDPELARFISLRQCLSAYCIPLRTGLETYGVLLYAHPEENFLTPDRREILDILGKQAVVAIQNASLYRDLETEKERMMEIQEEARKKLARDLHDGPTQSVAALAMRVNYARRLISQNVDAAVAELVKIEELARGTTKEIRHMLFTLRPLVLESQGLIAALESMVDKMRETYDQNVIIEADPEIIPQLEMGKQGVIFYIAEEAVNNARKHAKAKHIWVRLKTSHSERVLLEIEDDGVGFNVDILSKDYESRGSLGMVNLQERTEMVNGALQIESAEGRGTKITVIIPLSEEAAERLRRGL
jgi:signal transduction histidine kinase